MANILGLPEILVTFSSLATSSITRSSRGIVALILNDENVSDDDGVKYKLIGDSSDIPSGIEDTNKDLIEKTLLGTPLMVHTYFIPPATHTETQTIETVIESQVDSDVLVTDPDTGETDIQVMPVTVTDTQIETATVTVAAEINQAAALKKCANVKFDYIAHPTGNATDQQNLASWTAAQRTNRHKVYKAVVGNYAADNYGVINFTTGGIKVLKSADEEEYTTYTATQYTARIAGILAGLSLDRSATYYSLSEVSEVEDYDDIDSHINGGELCLFDEKDGGGVKIARGCNSLTTFTTGVGEDFRFIKIVEALDLIKEDISETFRNDYVGKVINTYDNKMLFVSAINSYLTNLQGNVLDGGAENRVTIDYAANLNYAKSHGRDVEEMSVQEILEVNTGTYVFLVGNITPVNAMEDLRLSFTLA